MAKFRTIEQFIEIVDSCNNANWTDAAQECITHGFSANDLINYNIHNNFENPYDIAILMEMVGKIKLETYIESNKTKYCNCNHAPKASKEFIGIHGYCTICTKPIKK